MRAVGMAGKVAAGTHSLLNRHCRQTQPVGSPSGTGLKTHERPTVGRLRSNQTAADDVGLSPCR